MVMGVTGVGVGVVGAPEVADVPRAVDAPDQSPNGWDALATLDMTSFGASDTASKDIPS